MANNKTKTEAPAEERTVKRRKSTNTRLVGRRGKTLPKVEDLVTVEDDQLIRELMVICAEQNEKMNAHKKAYESARKSLYKMMCDHKLQSYSNSQAEVNGTKVSLEAKLGCSTSRVIDVKKFHELVDEDVFMRCVSIAVGVAEENAGTNVVAQCAEKVNGNENVTVKSMARLK